MTSLQAKMSPPTLSTDSDIPEKEPEGNVFNAKQLFELDQDPLREDEHRLYEYVYLLFPKRSKQWEGPWDDALFTETGLDGVSKLITSEFSSKFPGVKYDRVTLFSSFGGSSDTAANCQLRRRFKNFQSSVMKSLSGLKAAALLVASKTKGDKLSVFPNDPLLLAYERSEPLVDSLLKKRESARNRKRRQREKAKESKSALGSLPDSPRSDYDGDSATCSTPPLPNSNKRGRFDVSSPTMSDSPFSFEEGVVNKLRMVDSPLKHGVTVGPSPLSSGNVFNSSLSPHPSSSNLDLTLAMSLNRDLELAAHILVSMKCGVV